MPDSGHTPLPFRMWIEPCGKCNGRWAGHVKPAFSTATEYVRADSLSALIEALEDGLWCLESWMKIKSPDWDGAATATSAIGKMRTALTLARKDQTNG